MNELTGGSDSAEIEVSKSRGVGGQMTIGGVFGIECFKPDGECFFSAEVPNLMTLEWCKEMAFMYAGDFNRTAAGGTEMDAGTASIIGALVTGTFTYSGTASSSGTHAYGYMLELGSVDTTPTNAHLYSTASIRTASTNFVDETRQDWGTAGIPLIFEGVADGTASTTTHTATNQRVHSTTLDERAVWVKDTATEVVKSVALVFSNVTTMGSTASATYNRLVARALLNGTTGVSLDSGDTIKVRYSIQTAVSAS